MTCKGGRCSAPVSLGFFGTAAAAFIHLLMHLTSRKSAAVALLCLLCGSVVGATPDPPKTLVEIGSSAMLSLLPSELTSLIPSQLRVSPPSLSKSIAEVLPGNTAAFFTVEQQPPTAAEADAASSDTDSSSSLLSGVGSSLLSGLGGNGPSLMNLTSTIIQELTNDPNFAFPSIVSALLPAPFVSSGACKAGVEYTIQSVRDVLNHLGELECIFAAGESPSSIGTGYYYGNLITAANTAVVAPLAIPFYQGDYVVKTLCKGSEVYLGSLHVAGLNLGTSQWTIGPLPKQVALGEYYNPKDNLVMDFTVDVNDLCPDEYSEARSLVGNSALGFLPFYNAVPPVNGFIDIGRVVGRDSRDGGIILLNKAMAVGTEDPTVAPGGSSTGLIGGNGGGLATVLYYTMKSFDPSINPDFTAGRKIVVPESFTYSRQGIRAPLERLSTVFNSTVNSVRHGVSDVVTRNSFSTFLRRSSPFNFFAGTTRRRVQGLQQLRQTILPNVLPSFLRAANAEDLLIDGEQNIEQQTSDPKLNRSQIHLPSI